MKLDTYVICCSCLCFITDTS